MTDWNPQIVRIEKIEIHPNADALEIATVLFDYPVVVKKGDFKVGDLAAYIPLNSIVPDVPRFEFMNPPRQEQYYDENGKQKTRVLGKKFESGKVPENFRTVDAKKIRGIYSQGLLLKGFIYEDVFDFEQQDTQSFREGDSVVEFLNLKKYEATDEDESKFTKNIRNGTAEKAPPFKVPYYDIEGKKFFSCLNQGEKVVLEEKIEGCSASYTYDENRLWVKSRNLFKPANSDCIWQHIAKTFNLEEKLSKYPMLSFFGEIHGQVKYFPYSTNGNPTIRFFDIFNIENQRFLDYENRNEILNDLELPIVPFLSILEWNIEEYENIKKFSNGKSTIDNSHVREGFVLRPVKERYEPKLNGRMMVKCVGEDYNLFKKRK